MPSAPASMDPAMPNTVVPTKMQSLVTRATLSVRNQERDALMRLQKEVATSASEWPDDFGRVFHSLALVATILVRAHLRSAMRAHGELPCRGRVRLSRLLHR